MYLTSNTIQRFSCKIRSVFHGRAIGQNESLIHKHVTVNNTFHSPIFTIDFKHQRSDIKILKNVGVFPQATIEAIMGNK